MPNSELFNDLRDHAEAVIRERGLSPDDAKRIGHEIAVRLSGVWGGQTIYIPRADWIEQRRQQIIEEYNRGEATRSIAHRYRVSAQWVRRIVAASG